MIFRYVTFGLPLSPQNVEWTLRLPTPWADQCVEARLGDGHRLCLVVRTTVAKRDGGFFCLNRRGLLRLRVNGVALMASR